MSDVALTYIGVVSPVRIPALDDKVVETGDTVEVPKELAEGEPATGQPGDADYHPGVDGLLAQEANWKKASAKDAKAAKETSTEGAEQ